MTVQEQLFGSELPWLIEHSINVILENEPSHGYYGCFSGGKDSIVLKALTEMAGVDVRWHYNVTTIDPPEVVYFIRDFHESVIFDRPKVGNFFHRMETMGFPTRTVRWCCREYKESQAPVGSVMLMGLRAEESPRRAKSWGEVTFHRKTKAPAISPIMKWSSDEVWEFIKGEGLPYPSLYDEGFHRLGCIGCPMPNPIDRIIQFERWPRFERLWKRAFRRIWEKRTGTIRRDSKPWFGDRCFSGWEEMYDGWLHSRPAPKTMDGPMFDI